MTTASKREVGFVVGVETTGSADIQRLAAEVRKLGAEGDPAAAEFKALADQLDRLGSQVDAVSAIRALNADVDRLAASQVEAAAATKAAKDALEAQTVTVAQMRAQQQQAAQAVSEGVAGTRAAADAVKALRRDYDAAGKATQEYKNAASAADAAVTAARNNVDALRTALTTAKAAATAASAEEGRLATAYLRTREAAGQADAAVRERSATLRTAENAATALAVSTTDLAQADAQLLDTQARLIAQLGALKAQQTERAALDAQNAEAALRASQNVRALASAHEQEQAALAESAARTAAAAAEKQRLADATEKTAAAERAAAAAIDAANAKRREQQEHDGQAAIAAYRLAEARKAAQAAAQSELLLLKDSEDFTRRYAAAQREAAAAVEREGVEAMRLLEQAARAADKAQEQLTASLRETEAAAEKYAAAIGEAAAAGEHDVAAAQKRRAAAEALIASERALTAEQREAASARDRTRTVLIAEAQALLASARAADESRAATGRLIAEARALGTVLDGTGKSISRIGTLTTEAFGQVGVRSLQAIEAEVSRTDAAMSRLARDMQAGRISAEDFARAAGAATVKLNQLNAEARQVNALPGQFERISSSIQGVISRFGALGAAVATVGVAVRPVIAATVALDQMRRTLTTVTGSADEAERQIAFLRKTSQQSGQSFTEVGASYAKFAASALQSGLSIKQTQDVFKSVALAAGNLGLSSDQAKRALEALSQIASKGTVSMEELRQQLGDALPGVLPLLAKELGLTQAELNKVVESGNLLALEAIPAIGRALVSLQPQDGVVNGMVATWNRFINVVKEAGTTLVEGPLGQTAGVVLKAFGGVLRDVSMIAVGASEAFKLLGLSTLAVFDALTPGGAKLKDLGKTLDDFAQQAATNISKFRDTAYGASEGTAALTDATAKLGGSFAKLALDNQKVIDGAVLAAQSSEKNAQAKKAEGEAAVTLAGLIGDETAKREAGVAAALLAAEAAQQQAKADEAVIAAHVAAKAALIERAKAEGIGTDAIKAAVEALDTKIAKATADAEKTRAQASAAEAHATALGLAAEAAENNAGRIDELKAKVVALTTEQENARIAMVSGAGTEEQAKKATDALAVAKGLLKDAIDDVSEALERQIKAMQADTKLAEAGIKLEIERQKNAVVSARLAGNEYAARQASLKIKELELRLGNLSVEQKRAEAEATLRAIAIEEDELRASGRLTTEKAIELESRRKVQLAAVLEAQAANESAKSKRVEYEELQRGTPAREAHSKATGQGTTATRDNTTATDSNSSALGKNVGLLNDAAGAADKAADARQRYNAAIAASRQYGSGVTDVSGLAGIKDSRLTDRREPGSDVQSVLGPGEYERGADGSLKSGFGAAGAGAGQYAPPDNSGGWTFDTAAWQAAGGALGGFATDASVRKFWKRTGPAPTRAAGSNVYGGSAGSAARAERTVNVNLNVGGKSVPVTTSSANADALLRALETAQRAAGV